MMVVVLATIMIMILKMIKKMMMMMKIMKMMKTVKKTMMTMTTMMTMKQSTEGRTLQPSFTYTMTHTPLLVDLMVAAKFCCSISILCSAELSFVIDRCTTSSARSQAVTK